MSLKDKYKLGLPSRDFTITLEGRDIIVPVDLILQLGRSIDADAADNMDNINYLMGQVAELLVEREQEMKLQQGKLDNLYNKIRWSFSQYTQKQFADKWKLDSTLTATEEKKTIPSKVLEAFIKDTKQYQEQEVKVNRVAREVARLKTVVSTIDRSFELLRSLNANNRKINS